MYPLTAIEEAVMNYRSGKVERSSHTYAPTSAEVAIEVRRVMDVQAGRARAPLALSRTFKSYNFRDKQDALRRQYEHRPVLREDVSLDEFSRMSRTREVQAGTIWVAALGTVYGPEN